MSRPAVRSGLLLLGLLLTLTVACATGPAADGGDRPAPPVDETPPPTAELQMASYDFDRDFRLVAGEKALVTAPDGTAREIRFDGVEGDSRCPRGVQCIWEGEAKVALTVIEDDVRETSVTVHTASSRNTNVAQIPGGWVRLVRLDPYPAEGVDPDPAEYAVTLSVSADEPETPGRAPDA